MGYWDVTFNLHMRTLCPERQSHLLNVIQPVLTELVCIHKKPLTSSLCPQQNPAWAVCTRQFNVS